nr:uncharacterized mitochondrial protein AtMg00810-like [Tanacetum cinerariifolium]
MLNKLDLLFSLMFDELLNGTTPVVSKSFDVTAADTNNQRQQHNTTSSTSTIVAAYIPPLSIQITPETTNQAPTVTVDKNVIQAETNKEYAQVDEDKFINIFSKPIQERGETSSQYVDSSNMHTFYQRYGEKCMFALTVSRTEPKNIKEAMAESIWIEAMQEELHQFDRLDVCVGTPMAAKLLDVDLSGTPVDQTKYRSMDGALMYLTASRRYIIHGTCYCDPYQARQTEKHLREVKRIFRYLKNTINMGLWYPKDTVFNLTAFSYSDHAGYLDTRKSTSGAIQFLGGDKLVSWSSKKQDCTSISLAKAEAEYVSLYPCCAQVLWLRTQLTDYDFHFDKIPMYCDSKAAIAISFNPV